MQAFELRTEEIQEKILVCFDQNSLFVVSSNSVCVHQYDLCLFNKKMAVNGVAGTKADKSKYGRRKSQDVKRLHL